MNRVFINSGINKCFKLYRDSKDDEESLDYNSFLVAIVRMLIVIYTKDIVACFETNNVSTYHDILMKYGFSQKGYNSFNLAVDKFVLFDDKLSSMEIRKKNKFFNLVQKYLIDMMVCKMKNSEVDKNEINEFYNLLFTINSKDFYKKSYALLNAYDPYEIDTYAKKNGITGE